MNHERYRALSVCVVLMEAKLRAFSRNEAMQMPKEGYERPFEETRQTLCVLREMLREVRYGDGKQEGRTKAD